MFLSNYRGECAVVASSATTSSNTSSSLVLVSKHIEALSYIEVCRVKKAASIFKVILICQEDRLTMRQPI
eukprot:1087865-Amphidinium_carterae.1